VNTVVLRGGRRTGHNTDWLAFFHAMGDGLADVSVDRIVQLGAGGGGSATAFAALKRGARHISIVDVDSRRSRALAVRMNRVFGDNKASAIDDASEALRTADGLIHATPTGMHGRPGLPLPAELIRRDLWVAEIVYFPLETELLRLANSLGCRTLDGSRMAVGQAVEAFRLFTGMDPEPARMHRHFLSLVEAR
jgi:shikimate dehydrogenase